MSIGERITDLRKERNISQAQLAGMLGVSRQAVSKWENDLNAPDTIKLIQLADALDTDVEYLATGNHTSMKSTPEIITIEKPVERIIEKVVEKPVVVEKPIQVEKIVERIVEKPKIKKVFRIRYVRNPFEFIIIATLSFLLGLLIGYFL